MEKFKEDQEVEKIRGEITSRLGEIEKYAKEKGLEFDSNEFLKYCQKRNVPVDLMQDVFEAKARPFIEKQIATNTEKTVLNNVQKNQKGAIVSGNKTAVPGKNASGWLDQITSVLNK